MKRIEIATGKYFAGLGSHGYSAKFSGGGIINIRISGGVIENPKPEELKVSMEWDDVPVEE